MKYVHTQQLANQMACSQTGINVHDDRGDDSRELMLFTVKGIVGEK